MRHILLWTVSRNAFLLTIFIIVLILKFESLPKYINPAIAGYRGKTAAIAFLLKIALNNDMFLICVSHRVIVRGITSGRTRMLATLKDIPGCPHVILLFQIYLKL